MVTVILQCSEKANILATASFIHASCERNKTVQTEWPTTTSVAAWMQPQPLRHAASAKYGTEPLYLHDPFFNIHLSGRGPGVSLGGSRMLVMLCKPGRQPVIDCHRVVIMRAVPHACTRAALCSVSLRA